MQNHINSVNDLGKYRMANFHKAPCVCICLLFLIRYLPETMSVNVMPDFVIESAFYILKKKP
jgi:hypothetical protein